MPGNLGVAAIGFAKSREQYENLVTTAYRRYLKRDPDAAGLRAWTKEMLAGRVTEELLEAGFIGSAEYITKRGGHQNWVLGMYRDLLGREPAEWEVKAWVQALASGTAEWQVALGFAASRERQGQRISRNYAAYLQRGASKAEIDAYVEEFAAGRMTNQDIIARFVGSREYYENSQKGQGNRAVWVVKTYEDVLFRSPDRSEVESWIKFLQEA